MNKNRHWKISDLIDLEYYLNKDNALPDHNDQRDIERRDRSIYLDHVRPLLPEPLKDSPEPDNLLVYHWLEKRKALHTEKEHTLHPGSDVYESAYSFLVFLFFFCGTVIGGSMAFSFLVYKGTEPLNISSYLGLFVLSQLVLLFILAGYLTVFRKITLFRNMSVVRYLFSALIIKTITIVFKRSSGRLSAENRTRLDASLGIIKGKSQIYGSLFPWPVFILGQLFGIGFNTGVLGATLFRVAGSDLAFGWQSTLRLSSDAVHAIVSTISIPWSWAVPEHLAHPGLLQIEGSRMVLKDGITTLATADLVSWWPFLCFCVLFYGLLPRLILFTAGILFRNLSLKRIHFQAIVFDRLILRMISPVVETGGFLNGSASVVSDGTNNETTSPVIPFAVAGGTVPLFIPDDISDRITSNDVQDIVSRISGAENAEVISTDFYLPDDMTSVETVMASPGNSFFFILEAWQPPIREVLEYLTELRNITGPDAKLFILLTGKPVADRLVTMPDDRDVSVWKQKIMSIGDPNLSVQPL